MPTPTYDEVEQLATRNLHKDSPTEVWQRLTQPDLIDLTLAVLTNVTHTVSMSLATRKTEMTNATVLNQAEVSEYEAWRKRATYFHGLALQRLRQVKAVIKQVHRDASQTDQYQQQGQLFRAVIALGSSIARHRAALEESGDDPDPIDDALWAALDTVLVPHGDGVATVARVLANRDRDACVIPPIVI